jgi:O2-independent ubiquinone biosynthesis protein UbiV
MKISIGPISYFWERQKVFDFYRNIEKTAVDIVYLGETICSKRRKLSLTDWLEIAVQLSKAGKEVVLSTLTLIEAASELSLQSRIAKNAQYTVEGNDMAAIHKLAGQQPFVIGPHINTYNSDTLEIFSDMGACRWVIPVELGNETISKILQQRPAGLETEIFAFGNLPLAFSARCYTARAHNRPKDSCGFICLDYPDGLPMFTQENEPFLILNGIQTQSVAKQNLVTLLDDINNLEIDVIRIMPQSEGTSEIIEIFHSVLNGNLQGEIALEKLATFHSFGKCNGYWFGKEGMVWIDNPTKQNGYGRDTLMLSGKR